MSDPNSVPLNTFEDPISVSRDTVEDHHKYYCDKKKKRVPSGFPQDNNPSIVKSTSAQEFSTFEGYRDEIHYYEFQKNYGKNPYSYATKKCDRFYDTYLNREIDYIVLHAGKQEYYRVRVLDKVKRGGRYFLKLQFV